jgi:glycosyltransferase involved in cell wall biosynthesis
LIVRGNFSLIYGNNILAAYALLAAIIVRKKTIWHIREAVEDKHSQLKYPPLGKRFIRFLMGRVAKVVFVSNALKGEFSLIYESGRSNILYNALPNVFFSMVGGSAAPRERDPVVIGVPGTIRPEKGVDFFLEAIIKNSKKIDGLHFLISGTLESQYAREMKKKVESSSIAQQVEFVGEVDDMIKFYDSCDFICVPSPYETFGRTIVEAGARNRAVICCSEGGAQEIIGKGERGLYVEYGDDAALIKALMLLAEDIELRGVLADELRSWVLQHASFDGFFQKFKRITISST